MSRVLLLRHSKAAKAAPGMRDFDRPLEERGKRHAANVGEAMAAAELAPGIVLCSPARRTRETWEGVRRALNGIHAVRFLDELYHFDAVGYLGAIRSAGPAESVLVIGHNPTISEVASMLAGDGEPQAIASMRSRFPTSSLAVIGFDVPLSHIEPGCGRLETWMVRD